MNLTDTHLPQVLIYLFSLFNAKFQRGCEHLDIAIIGFFEQFRKFYIGEMMHKSAQVSICLLLILLFEYLLGISYIRRTTRIK